MRAAATLLLALLAAGCTMPVAAVNTVDSRPHLQFTHASPGATVTIDGTAIGPAAAYDGAGQTLAVASGTHHVEIRDGARVLFDQTLYLGADATRTIDLSE